MADEYNALAVIHNVLSRSTRSCDPASRRMYSNSSRTSGAKYSNSALQSKYTDGCPKSTTSPLYLKKFLPEVVDSRFASVYFEWKSELVH